jgi:hypothetical protein
MKTIVIHQPDFMPYLGFFHRFLNSDLWVILDNVQFVSKGKGWNNRDKIKTPNGEKWLTVSVEKAPLNTPINEILLSANNWKNDNLNLITANYRKAPFFTEIMPYIEKLYSFECEKLIDFNLKSIDMLLNLFDIKIEKILASPLAPVGKNNELVVDILKKVDADIYLSGVGARAYFEPVIFDNAGIQVIWQEFTHPVYNQLHGDFIPYLSSLDLLFNCGVEESKKILRSL